MACALFWWEGPLSCCVCDLANSLWEAWLVSSMLKKPICYAMSISGWKSVPFPVPEDLFQFFQLSELNVA